MAIIVEDGGGLAGAETYCSVSYATAHHGARAQGDAWDAVDDKEAALRLAAEFIEQTYRGAWQGQRSTSKQALDWPRMNVPWPDSPKRLREYNVIPSEVMKACAELALRTASGALLADLGRETVSETVDVISVTYKAGGARQTRFASVDGWLRSLLKGGGSMISLVRA